jgi:hypothetical protein
MKGIAVPKRLQRNKNGQFTKDDYVGDLMDIAASSRLLVDHAKGGTPVPELPDIEGEARASVEGLDEAVADLDAGMVFAW